MNKLRNIPEKAKNIIIILLFVSAVFLGWESRLFGNSSVKLSIISGLVDNNPVSSGSSQDTEKTIGQARPLSIAVTDGKGAHYGVKYNLNEIGIIYNKTVHIFGQALGSAQAAVKVSEQDWRTALKSSGAYFEYMSPIRLSILGGWYGATMSGDWSSLTTRRICVAVSEMENRLYFQDDATGLFYAAETSIASDSITNLTESYSANNTTFAFEIISPQSLKDPYVLLTPDVTAYAVIKAQNPFADENKQAEALQQLNVSEHLKPIYSETDGAQVFIDNDFTVRVFDDGSVRWTSSQESPFVQLDENAAIEAARSAISVTVGKYCGDSASVYFDSISRTGASDYQITFKYAVAGGQIYLNKDGYAAIVTIKNGTINEMALHYRTYANSGTKKLLPEIQAAAAADGMFMLSYSDNSEADNGGGILEPSWVVVSPNS